MAKRRKSTPDMIGRELGRLKIMGVGRPPAGTLDLCWACECECGYWVMVLDRDLIGRGGKTQSCGCLRRDRMREMRASTADIQASRISENVAVIRAISEPQAIEGQSRRRVRAEWYLSLRATGYSTREIAIATGKHRPYISGEISWLKSLAANAASDTPAEEN